MMDVVQMILQEFERWMFASLLQVDTYNNTSGKNWYSFLWNGFWLLSLEH
jgi:hypothetical protein